MLDEQLEWMQLYPEQLDMNPMVLVYRAGKIYAAAQTGKLDCNAADLQPIERSSVPRLAMEVLLRRQQRHLAGTNPAAVYRIRSDSLEMQKLSERHHGGGSTWNRLKLL